MSETISCPFTFVKDGIFYFSCCVLSELREHYFSSRIAYSLRTRSPRIAATRARRAADQLDEYWFHLRCKITELPGKHMLRELGTVQTVGIEQPLVASSSSVVLSEAVRVFLHLKDQVRPITFHRAAERACGYVIDACGDKYLEAYTKADANAFRDALIARGLAGSSMARVFGSVRAETNFAASEHGLAPQSGAMGYSVPAAIAARVAAPERLVVCFAGDGDFQMTMQELATAQQHGAQPTILLLNNSIYGTIRAHQERNFPTRVSGTTMANPDFVALARAYGFHAERVDETAGFAAAFERARASDTGALLDLVISPEALTPRVSLSQMRDAALAKKAGA